MSELRELIEAAWIAADSLDMLSHEARKLKSPSARLLRRRAYAAEKALAALDAAPEVALERAVVEAAMDLTQTAHEMGVIDPISHIAVAMDLRKYAAKENAVFNACAALDRARKGGE